ncbi:hypothetical protein [Agriterribacter humi]|uniref:hypothetical protein n=1 Tax=Agriterribacter humi TaxID=1104781 RepID=UPI001264A879|nr:hypothetical protein [Agriterribacter humi]
MAKAAKKAPKKRADKYEEKEAIKGSFEDVIGVSVKNSNKSTKNMLVEFTDNIRGIDYSFQRVFYADKLKYHVTYNDADNTPVTFRMSREDEGYFKIEAQSLPIQVLDSEGELSNRILENEEQF